MPIVATEILYKYSVNTGPGNSTAGTAADSLGGFMASTVITDNVINNWFDDISGTENAASEAEYRCIFVHNSNASLAYQNAQVFIFSEVAGGANLNIGLATQGVVSATLATAQAARIANEDTAPSPVVTFSAPTAGAPLTIGNIPAGSCIGIWLRRTATNSAALNSDGATLRVIGDTAA